MKKGFLLISSLVLLGLITLCIGYFSNDFRRQLFFAERGNIEAQIFVAQAYQNGLDTVTQDTCKSHIWWQKAANQNNTSAQLELGKLYINSPTAQLKCIQPSPEQIKNYVILATDNGHYDGYYTLAEHHSKDIQQKINYLEQGAVHNDPNALYTLSSHYFSRNPAYSLHLLETAAELGNIKSQTFLGDIYAGMTYTSKFMNFPKALVWYDKAAEQGDLNAIKNLALLHLYGHGTEQSYDKAAYYLKKAADQGDKESKLTLAMLIVLDRGIGIHNYGSKNQSVDVIHALANQGYIDAQIEIGRLYLLGLGVLQDYQKAAEWFQKAANQSDRLAFYQLGVLYATGNGVMQNPRKAQEFFFNSRYREYIDTSAASGKGIIDEGYPNFKVY